MSISKEEQSMIIGRVNAAIEEKTREIATGVIKDLLKSMNETKEMNEKILHEIKLNKEDLNQTKKNSG